MQPPGLEALHVLAALARNLAAPRQCPRALARIAWAFACWGDEDQAVRLARLAISEQRPLYHGHTPVLARSGATLVRAGSAAAGRVLLEEAGARLPRDREQDRPEHTRAFVHALADAGLVDGPALDGLRRDPAPLAAAFRQDPSPRLAGAVHRTTLDQATAEALRRAPLDEASLIGLWHLGRLEPSDAAPLLQRLREALEYARGRGGAAASECRGEALNEPHRRSHAVAVRLALEATDDLGWALPALTQAPRAGTVWLQAALLDVLAGRGSPEASLPRFRQGVAVCREVVRSTPSFSLREQAMRGLHDLLEALARAHHLPDPARSELGWDLAVLLPDGRRHGPLERDLLRALCALACSLAPDVGGELLEELVARCEDADDRRRCPSTGLCLARAAARLGRSAAPPILRGLVPVAPPPQARDALLLLACAGAAHAVGDAGPADAWLQESLQLFPALPREEQGDAIGAASSIAAGWPDQARGHLGLALARLLDGLAAPAPLLIGAVADLVTPRARR